MYKFLSNRSIKKIKKYITIALISLILQISMFLFYSMGYGHPIEKIQNPICILINILAACSMLFYLNNSIICNSLTYPIAPTLIALAYSLSGFALCSKASFDVYIIYLFFPIQFLFMELYIFQNKLMYYTIGLCLFYIISPQTALPLNTLLFFIYIFECLSEKKLRLNTTLKMLVAYLFAIGISAFRLFPYVSQLYTPSDYTGFEWCYHPIIFLSRFLLGSFSDDALSSAYGCNLYVPCIFVLGTILFFIQSSQTICKKICYVIISTALFFAVNTTPAIYLLYLCNYPATTGVIFSFIITFWILRLSVLSFTNIKTSKSESIIAFLLFLTGVSFILLCCNFNFHKVAILSIIIFLTLTFIIIIQLLYSNDSKLLLPICFITIELFCNAFISTNYDFLPDTRSSAFTFTSSTLFHTLGNDDSENIPVIDTATQTDQITNSEYQDYIQKHTNYSLYQYAAKLSELFDNDDIKYVLDQDKHVMNDLDYYNYLYKNIESNRQLFIPCEADIHFIESDLYRITDLGNHIFNIEFSDALFQNQYYYIPYSIETDENTDNLYMYNDYTSTLYTYHSNDESGQGTNIHYLRIYPVQEVNINFQLLTYHLDAEAYETLGKYITQSYQSETTSYLLPADYFGMVVSCIFIFLFVIICYIYKSTSSSFMHSAESFINRLVETRFIKKINHFIYQNRIYLLSFLIPFLLFIFSMVLYDCIPFGQFSFFDEDGFCLTFPNYMELHYSLKNNHTAVSMNGGYGYNLQYNPISIIINYIFRFISPNAIPSFVLFELGITMGLCGFTMTYYLTHRLTGKSASKNDPALIIPALIYSLSSYMLSMHEYPSWFFVFFMLPLLLLGMDYLMFRRRPGLYIFSLTFCIIYNVALSLYICIFLVLYFFIYNFESIAAFFKKGILFAISSILSAGGGIICIYNTLYGSQDLIYNQNDSIYPTFGFHTAFFTQWANHLCMSPLKTVTADDGYISLYYGLLSMILILLYFSSKEYKIIDKIKRCILLILLYLSFNGKVISFVINGMHYQSKVPNRHVFLLLFLIAVISFDALIELKKISMPKFISLAAIICAFLSACFYFGKDVSKLSFGISMLFIILYVIFFILYHKKRALYLIAASMIFICEISANMLYSTSQYNLTSFATVNSYTELTNLIDKEFRKDNPLLRTSFPSAFATNMGLIYNMGSNSLFNSFVTEHTVNCNYNLGFYSGVNNISSNYNGTPFGHMLGSTNYIMIPIYNNMPIEDLNQYEYIGKFNHYYIYKNNYALPIGYYVPYEISNLYKSTGYLPSFINQFSELFLPNQNPILSDYYIEYDESTKSDNSFYCTNKQGEILTAEETTNLYEELKDDANCFTMRDIKMHLNLNPSVSGTGYLITNEIVGLGQLDLSQNNKTLFYPNAITPFREAYNYTVFNQSSFENLYQEMSKNILTDIVFEKDTIYASSNYDKDGYTMFSIAWDPNWHAYIDDKEVEIEDILQSFIFIKTPSGKHTIKLKYIPKGVNLYTIISIIFWGISILFCNLLRNNRICRFGLKKRK